MRRSRETRAGGRLPNRVASLVMVGALLLTGCSRPEDSPATTDLVIGLSVPLSGTLAGPGMGIRNSVEMAVSTANAKHLVPGVRFVLDERDDRADPQVAQVNAAVFAANPKVIGVIGPYNSSVAVDMVPVLAQAGLVQISPSNTLPELTWGTDYEAQGRRRPYPTYFRTATTDAVQGVYVARYVRERMGLHKVAIVTDTKAYGRGLAKQFAVEFERMGGRVVVQDMVQPGATDFTETVGEIGDSGAELVYYGGESPEAGRLSAQLKAAGVRVPLAGGDAVHDDDFLRLAGHEASGDIASSDGSVIDELASAFSYFDRYAAAAYREPPGTFGPYAYDSAWALLLAVGRIAADHGGTLPSTGLRKAMVLAVQETDFFGVTGDVAFDEFGDSRSQVVSLYVVREGKWLPLVPSARLNSFR